MQLDNIQVGMRIKNYRALCDLLGEPTKGGDSKNAQLKEWARYFLSERQGNAFIIKEIYATPLPSDDGRAKYLRYLEPILFSFLADCDGEHETTVRQWGIDLGVFTEDTFDEKQQEQFSEDYNVDSYTLRRAVNDTAELFKKSLYSALSVLQKRGLLTYESNLYVVNLGGGKHIASKEEAAAYDALKNSIMTSLGYANMWLLYGNKAKTKAYYERMKAAMLKQYGWTNAYTLLCVSAVGDHTLHYEKMDTNDAITRLRNALRITIRDRAIASETQNTKKVYEAWDDGFDKKVFQLPAWFASTTSAIFDEFMGW